MAVSMNWLTRKRKATQTITKLAHIVPVRGGNIQRGGKSTQLQPVRKTITINVPTRRPSGNSLAACLERGRRMHPLCRDSFIERHDIGYYHYERRTEWHTCAVAAAYAGAFGARAIETAVPVCSPARMPLTGPSGSQMTWQLSHRLGIDLQNTAVYGPTGRRQPIADEMIQLTDRDGWTRAGIVSWLQSLRIRGVS